MADIELQHTTEDQEVAQILGGFKPEYQQVFAVLAATTEPLSPESIVNFASSQEQQPQTPQVSLRHVNNLITAITAIEGQTDSVFLERSVNLVPDATQVSPNFTSIRPVISYRLAPPVQQWLAETIPSFVRPYRS
jgi:hypothetical protein